MEEEEEDAKQPKRSLEARIRDRGLEILKVGAVLSLGSRP